MIIFKYVEDGNFHALSIMRDPRDKSLWGLYLDYEPIRSYKRLQDAKASATKRKNALLKKGVLPRG